MPIFLEVGMATGLMLHSGKCVMINFGTQSAHVVRRILSDIPGASSFQLSDAAIHLEVKTGPWAMDTYRDKAMAK